MDKIELIKELRELTKAGMNDCKEALQECNWDLQKAVDVVKAKGLNIVSGRDGRAVFEGKVDIVWTDTLAAMVEVNCQTDFVANSLDFARFVSDVKHKLYYNTVDGLPFGTDDVEEKRKEAVSTIKENIVVRRWWVEQAMDSTVKVFAYHHSNNKIGVLITMQAPSTEAANSPEFKALGEDLAMQICAMSPLAVSSDRISQEEKDRQKAIFETQLKEEKKPEKMWEKIMEGRWRKWYAEVCLLEQESIVISKTPVKQVIENMQKQLGGEIKIINFVRAQVGEGLQKTTDDLAQEVSKMVHMDDGILS